MELKTVGTWRNTADLSTKVQGKRKILVLLNLMGYVDARKDCARVGEQERIEDEQRQLEKKAVLRLQKGELQGAYRTFRLLMVQSLIAEGIAATQGLEPEAEERRNGTFFWLWFTAMMIILMISVAIWRKLRRIYQEWNERIQLILERQEREGAQSRNDAAATLEDWKDLDTIKKGSNERKEECFRTLKQSEEHWKLLEKEWIGSGMT